MGFSVRRARDSGTTSISLPAGSIIPFAGQNAPDGWFLCYGQELASANHSHAFTDFYVYRYTGNVDYGNYYDGYYPTTIANNTGTQSANHTHTTSIDVPAFTGTSGDGGFANTAVDKMQPTMVLNYIIKAV